MSSLETINETDFYWVKKPKGVKKILIASSVDVSPLPYIVASSIIDGLEKIGTIHSKLMYEKDWFRTIGEKDEFGDTGWDIYQDGDLLVIVVSAIHPIATNNLWLFTYPIIRDTCDMLSRLGVKELNLLTTAHLNAFAIENKNILPIEEIITINSQEFNEDVGDGKSMLLPTHSWLFAWVFRKLGGKAFVRACGGDKPNLLSEEGLDALIEITEGLGYKIDRELAQTLYEEFESAVSNEAKNGDVMTEFKQINGEEKGNVMFG
tara:strand:+ start:639 stop:1427 length:789 start_codon:yes stop_codon:yes gene_type:complete